MPSVSQLSPPSHKSTPKPLPPGWKWVKLEDICEFIRGVSFDAGVATSYPKEDYIPILRAGNIKNILDTSEDIMWVPPRYIIEGQLLKINDIVICMSSGSPEVVGKTATLESEWYGSVGAFCSIIRVINLAFPSFIGQWFRCHLFIKWRDNQARGANIQNLRFSQLSKLEIPLPPLPEQKRIATILKEQLAAVDKARKAAEERLEAVKALPAAFLRKVFPQTGQPLPEGWKWVKLGEVCEEFTGISDLQKQPDNKFLYVDISSVDNERKEITESSLIMGRNAPSRARQIIKTNDIILSTTRPNLNAVAIVPEELNNQICSTGFCVLRPIKQLVETQFVFGFLQSDNFVRLLSDLVKGALYPAVTNGQVRIQPFPLPPIAEQKRIATVLKEQLGAVDKARKASEEELKTINALPAAILRKAFNGEL